MGGSGSVGVGVGLGYKSCIIYPTYFIFSPQELRKCFPLLQGGVYFEIAGDKYRFGGGA